MTEKELLDLKEEIEEAKSKVSELKGQKKGLMNQLKKDYGCSSLKDAKVKLKGLSNELIIIESTIQEKVEELENKYDL